MKNNKILYLTIAILLLPFTIIAQSYISKTIDYDGETREYDIYIPASYDSIAKVPLIFNFHGGGGDIASQIYTADMSPIADTANFIAVYPQALEDPSDVSSLFQCFRLLRRRISQDLNQMLDTENNKKQS